MNLASTQQRGIALLVSLVMLLILTVLAISAASTSSVQSRMSSNAQDSNLAFQTAETGLARWTDWFESNSDKDKDFCTRLSNPGNTLNTDIGKAKVESVSVVSAPCGSIGGGSIESYCYHVTSVSSTADGHAVATHQMGYKCSYMTQQ